MLRKLFRSKKTAQPIRFYLTSFDSKVFSEPRLCTVHRILTGEERDDYILVSVNPVVVSPVDEQTHDKLVLAGRFSAVDFQDPTQDVYIFIATNWSEINEGLCSERSIEMVATGEIFPVHNKI